MIRNYNRIRLNKALQVVLLLSLIDFLSFNRQFFWRFFYQDEP